MSEEKIKIPEDLQQICRDIGAVAKKHKLHRLTGEFQPGYTSNWDGDIGFRWESGRHEADSDNITITSKFFVCTTITNKKTS